MGACQNYGSLPKGDGISSVSNSNLDNACNHIQYISISIAYTKKGKPMSMCLLNDDPMIYIYICIKNRKYLDKMGTIGMGYDCTSFYQ